MSEEKEGVMRNAMTTRAPGGANNWWCKPQVAMIILNNFFGHVLVEMSWRSLKKLADLSHSEKNAVKQRKAEKK